MQLNVTPELHEHVSVCPLKERKVIASAILRVLQLPFLLLHSCVCVGGFIFYI